MRKFLLLALLTSIARADLPVVQQLDHCNVLAAGPYAISAPMDGYPDTVRILDLEHGRVAADLGLASTLSQMAVSPVGDWLALQVDVPKPEVVLFRLSTARRRGRFPTKTFCRLAASPQGDLLAVLESKRLALYTPDGKSVRSWSVKANSDDSVRFLDAKKVAVRGQVWNLQGQKLSPVAPPAQTRSEFSPDGRYHISHESWTDQPLRVLQGKKVLLEKTGQELNAVFSEDSRQVAVLGADLEIYSLPEAKLLRRVEGLQAESASFVGSWILGREGGPHPACFLLNAPTGQVTHLPRPGGAYPATGLTPGRLCLGSAQDHSLWLFDTAAGQPLAVVPETLPLESPFAPNGKLLLAVSRVQRSLVGLSADRAEPIWSTPIPAKGWKEDEQPERGSFSWSADGLRVLASLDLNQPLSMVVQSDTGHLIRRFSESSGLLSADGQQVGQFDYQLSVADGRRQNLRGMSRYSHVSYSPDGTMVALHGPGGFRLLKHGKPVLSIPFAKPVDAVAGVWSPDSRWLGLACSAGGRNGGGLSHLVDTQKLTMMPLARPDRISELCFSPDSRWLLSGGNSLMVSGLWKRTAGGWKLVRQIVPIPGQYEGFDAHFSPDGRILIYNTFDRLRFYSRDGGQLLGCLQIFSGQDWLAYTPSGGYDGSPGGIERLWLRGQTLQDLRPASQAPELRRPGLLARWFAPP